MLRLLLLLSAACLLTAKPMDNTMHKLAVNYAEKYPNEHEENLEYGELVDGDIILLEGDTWPPQVNGYNAILDEDKYWPDAILYYTIDEDLYTTEQLADIDAGIQDLIENTKVNGEICLDIRPRVDETNYVYVTKTGGCSSSVGMRGGRQTLSLEDSCVSRHGTIMHEFMHAYGFHHEHCRGDRDDYVFIYWDNIELGKYNNFVKYEEGTQVTHLETHYDYGSVMHYSAFSFNIDPDVPTVIPKDPEAEIGQRTHLSECDIVRLQMLYGCIDEPYVCHEDDGSPPDWPPEGWTTPPINIPE